MKKIFIPLALALTSLPACSLPTKHHSSSSSELKVLIDISQHATRDQWTVHYQLSQPVKDLVFSRQTNRFRGNNWQVITPGLEIREDQGLEKITSADGKSFQEVVVEFNSYYDFTPKDYVFFQAFSDSSVAMYTGHLNACPTNEVCEAPVRFHFKGRDQAHVVVEGEVHEREANWIDQKGRGTYVYFGKIKPLEQSRLTAIIDPSLPVWLKTNLFEKLPKIFEFYEKSTQRKLDFKPFIFISYSPMGQKMENEGGTLPGLIQMSIKGKGWMAENPKLLLRLLNFFAHESAHLWNGQLFPYASNDKWMHEGGADAFSYLALLKLNMIQLDQFLDFQTAALNECLARIKTRPLRQVTEDPSFKAFYRCGAILALITHAAVKRKDKSLSLFQFWEALFSQSNREHRPYTEEMYFTVLNQLSLNPSLASGMRTFLDGPIDAPAEYLIATLQKLGVKLSKPLGTWKVQFVPL